MYKPNYFQQLKSTYPEINTMASELHKMEDYLKHLRILR